MFTKSKIQIIRENCEIASNYNDSLNALMEKYNIEDSIFIYKNSQLFEVTKGYFEKINEFDTLKEAISACGYQYSNIGVRVLENKKFEIGYIKKNLSECNQESNIFDIDCLTYIR